MSTLVVGPHSSWSYPQSWPDVVEIGLVRLLRRPPLEVNFMGGVSWSSQQLVFLLNSGRGEEIGVHGTDTGGHDTGLVPSPVLGTGEICIAVLRDKETERFLCGLRLSLHTLVSFHAPLHDSSGDSRESIGGRGCSPYPSCQESTGAKCAIRSWEANSSSWGSVGFVSVAGNRGHYCTSCHAGEDSRANSQAVLGPTLQIGAQEPGGAHDHMWFQHWHRRHPG